MGAQEQEFEVHPRASSGSLGIRDRIDLVSPPLSDRGRRVRPLSAAAEYLNLGVAGASNRELQP